MSIRRGSTICTWCNPSWRCPTISPCSNAAACALEPAVTRDPAKIRAENILMAMMAIAAVYEPYQVQRLNHGIGYATAAIELILPTFAAKRGLKGKVARHFVLNPHPTLIPAIEDGFVDSVYCFGSELCRTVGRVRSRGFGGLHSAAGDDLRRRCHPCHH